MKKLTIEQFIEKAKLIHGDIYDYLKFIYQGNRIEGIIICNICGNEFLMTPNNHLQKNGCPNCGKEKRNKSRINTIIKNNGSLLDNYPELCKEWDYEKNFPLTPNQVTCSSHKKVWWVCKNNHKWNEKVCWRLRKNICSYCSGQAILKGFNDLATLRPDLCLEWNYEKNYPLTPDIVALKLNKKIWWKCNNNHEWKVCVNDRVAYNTKCPYCNEWKNQEKCREIFEQLFKVKFIKKRFYCFKNLKFKSYIEFDGYNEELKIAFEYQGYQHYVYPNYFQKNKIKFLKQRSMDLFKQQYCSINKIKLFVVPYWVKDLENYIIKEIGINEVIFN